MDWIDVQDNNYRYVCWLDKNYMHVKIAIDEFMFIDIAFTQT